MTNDEMLPRFVFQPQNATLCSVISPSLIWEKAIG